MEIILAFICLGGVIVKLIMEKTQKPLPPIKNMDLYCRDCGVYSTKEIMKMWEKGRYN